MSQDDPYATDDPFFNELNAVRTELDDVSKRLDAALEARGARPGLPTMVSYSDDEMMHLIAEWQAATERQRAFLAKWVPDADVQD